MTLKSKPAEGSPTSPTHEFVAVCRHDDLIENVGQCALVGGRQIALFRVSDSDRLFAVSNYDPFSEANVLSRGVVGDLQGRIVVASPIYKQHFDLNNGQCLEDAEVKLEVFETRLRDGVVYIAQTGEVD